MFADVRGNFAGALFNALGTVSFAPKVHKMNTFPLAVARDSSGSLKPRFETLFIGGFG
jgi:hypothetical protein